MIIIQSFSNQFIKTFLLKKKKQLPGTLKMKFIFTFLLFSILIILIAAKPMSNDGSDEGSNEKKSIQQKEKVFCGKSSEESQEVASIRDFKKSFDGGDSEEEVSRDKRGAKKKQKSSSEESSSSESSEKSSEKSSEEKEKVESSTVSVAEETTIF